MYDVLILVRYKRKVLHIINFQIIKAQKKHLIHDTKNCEHKV